MMEDHIAKIQADIQELKDMKEQAAEEERQEKRREAQRLLDLHDQKMQRNKER